MKIRADDPAAMKDFILGVQNRVNELKASSGDSQESINGKRVRYLQSLYRKTFVYYFLLVICILQGNFCRWSSCLKPYWT